MTAEDRALIAQLRALQKRIKNFHGVIFDRQARKYRAAITYNGRIEVLGFFTEEVEAFRHYRAAAAKRPTRIDRFESPARVLRLLDLAGRFPTAIRPEPVFGSSLDQRRNRDFDVW
jgi:hypothetical protein